MVSRSTRFPGFGVLFAVSVLATGSATAQRWEPSTGPEGGTVNAIAIFDGSVYAGSGSGVYRSRDGGVTWKLTDPQLHASVNAFLVDGGSLFAGTEGDGIFRSEDGGEHWMSVSVPEDSNRYVFSLGRFGSQLLAGGLWSALRSDDGGATWRNSGQGLFGQIVRGLAFRDGVAFAGLSLIAVPPPASPGGGVFKSVDGGETWVPASEGLSPSVTSLTVTPTAIVAGTWEGIYRSFDDARSWLRTRSGSTFAFAEAPEGLLAGTVGGVALSIDEGASWSSATSQILQRVNALAVDADSRYAGTESGVFVSRDRGANWNLQVSGMTNSYSISVSCAVGQAYSVRYGLRRGGPGFELFRSQDSGVTWLPSGEGLPEGFSGPTAVQGNTIYLGVAGHGVYKSVDLGRTWRPSNAGIDDVHVFALVASDDMLIVATDIGLFRSTDGGGVWVRGQPGIPAYDYVHSFAFVGGNVYAGGNFGIYKSTNEALSWTPTGPQVGKGRWVVSGPGGELYAYDGYGSDTRLFISRDGGASWAEPAAPLPIPALALLPTGEGLFVGGMGGVYFSRDDGASWRSANDGLVVKDVQSLAQCGSKVFAAVYGNGVQTLRLRSGVAAPPRRPVPRVVLR